MMTSAGLKSIIPSVIWKSTNRDVILTQGAWFGHVLKEHPEMQGKQGLLERALRNCLEINNQAFRWSTTPPDELYIQYGCEDFKPYNDHIRARMKIIDQKAIIVLSAYPVFGIPGGIIKI